MSEPITKEERQAIRARYEEIGSMRPVVTDAIIQKWLHGYEALVVDLEADRNKYRAMVIEEAATPGQWSKLRGKVSDLERRLKIATQTLQRMVDGGCCDDGELLSCTTEMASEALAAMAKVEKS